MVHQDLLKILMIFFILHTFKYINGLPRPNFKIYAIKDINDIFYLSLVFKYGSPRPNLHIASSKALAATVLVRISAN